MNDHIIVFNQICVSYLKSKMVVRVEHSLTYHLNYMYQYIDCFFIICLFIVVGDPVIKRRGLGFHLPV
jgi:hypothetical protein